MFRYVAILSLFLAICSSGFAEPAPFGIEINKSTYQEVTQKYTGFDVGLSKYSMGKLYDIDCRQINIEGMKAMRAVFSAKGVLLALLTEFDKNRYDSLLRSLSQKYQLISKQDPFVGNRSALFKSGHTIIELDAPHMSFVLTLSYTDQEFKKKALNKSRQEHNQKKAREANTL